jgi:hypothetical protein
MLYTTFSLLLPLAGLLAAQVPGEVRDDDSVAIQALAKAAREAKVPADADAITRLKVERLNALGETISVRFQLYLAGKESATLLSVAEPARMCRRWAGAGPHARRTADLAGAFPRCDPRDREDHRPPPEGRQGQRGRYAPGAGYPARR